MAGKRVINQNSGTAVKQGGGSRSKGSRLIGKKKKKGKAKRRIISLLAVLAILAGLYLTAVYSSIPFIEKWRTIYIETAMSTKTHQWLATRFIPKSVIDEVMAQVEADLAAQENLNSTWDEESPTVTPAAEKESPEPTVAPTEAPVEVEDTEAMEFYETYWELDTTSFRSYLEKNPSLTSEGYDSILLEDLKGSLGLTDANGNVINVVDTENNLLIVTINQDGYAGKLAIVKNAAQVDVVKSKSLGTVGEQLITMAPNNDAILAINASGFGDAEGHGNGGLVVGSLVIDGVDYGHPEGSSYKFFGFKEDNRLYITTYSSAIVSEYRWAIQFFPALIVDGKSVVDGSFGMGLQPRASFGQAKNGDVMMLIIDGRQVGHSLGCTVSDCTDILLEYNAYQAMNLDGGSSALMWYRGQNITSTSSPNANGRYLPDCFIVRAAADVE